MPNGERLLKGGDTVTVRHRSTDSILVCEGERVEWTYDYIYDNYVKPNKVTKVLDMTKVAEFLRQRVPAIPPCHTRACAPRLAPHTSSRAQQEAAAERRAPSLSLA